MTAIPHSNYAATKPEAADDINLIQLKEQAERLVRNGFDEVAERLMKRVKGIEIMEVDDEAIRDENEARRKTNGNEAHETRLIEEVEPCSG